MSVYHAIPDAYSPLPWELTATAQTAGEYVPVSAEYAAPPADAYRRPARPLAYCPPPGAPFGSPETVPVRTVALLRRYVVGETVRDGATLCKRLFAARSAFLGRRLDAHESARLVMAARALWRCGTPVAGGRAF